MSFPKGTATADRKARKAASIRYDRAQSARRWSARRGAVKPSWRLLARRWTSIP